MTVTGQVHAASAIPPGTCKMGPLLVWMLYRKLNLLPMAKIESRLIGQLSRGQVTVFEVSYLQILEQICGCMRACARLEVLAAVPTRTLVL